MFIIESQMIINYNQSQHFMGIHENCIHFNDTLHKEIYSYKSEKTQLGIEFP